MLEYDYKIIRDEGDEIVVFEPNTIPSNLPNLVYIEGPNSSGKSTLLNIIALGLYGSDKKGIPSALKDKMNSLMDNNYQELTFDFKIYVDNKTGIKAIKKLGKKDEIKVFEIKNGKEKPISKDRFEREYNLIYDIPENPTERLNQLTNSIKEIQGNRKNSVALLRRHVQNVISDVKNSRDPKRIEKLTNELKKSEKNKEKLEEKIKRNNELLDSLERYTYCRYYLEYFKKFEKIDKKIGKLEKENKSINSKRKKQDRKYETIKKKADNDKEFLKEKNYELILSLKSSFSKEYNNYTQYLEKANLDDNFLNAEFPENYQKILINLQNSLTRILKEKQSSESLEEAMIWEKIISILEDNKSKDFIVPGIDAKISEFIRILKDANDRNEKILQYVKMLRNLIKKIDDMKERLSDLRINVFPKLKELLATQGVDALEKEILNEDVIADSIKQREDILSNCDFYYRECAKKNISDEEIEKIFNKLALDDIISPFNSYSENEIVEKINSLQKKIHVEETENKTMERQILLRKDEIKRLMERKPHKFQDKQKELTSFFKECQVLEQKLIKYNNYINDIIAKRAVTDLPPDEDKYYLEISKYLGKIIGYIRHVDGEYKINRIDMINKVILTENNKKIRFIDMGTGQGQSTYLLGKLDDYDKRKIIALFDEVAMMDKKSLTPVYNRLRKLHENGKLLLGIVVQKGDETKIEDLR